VKRSDLPVVRLRRVTEADWETHRQWRLDPDVSDVMFGEVTQQRLDTEKEKRFVHPSDENEVFRAVTHEHGRFIGEIRFTREDVDHIVELAPQGV
jgi:RimJ/RimL family protein N-acetyltransferase